MDIRDITVAGQKLRIATSAGSAGSLPLLVFNGLGADLEVLHGFAREMGEFGIGIVTFDVPGIGGSSVPALPYRFAWLAHLANDVLTALGIQGQVDVAGMSWGGALAQEFTYRYPKRVRRLLLAATSPGGLAVPGRLSALLTMLDPRLYIDRDHMARVGGELYGGKMRTDSEPLKRYGKLLRPVGCSFQLLAVTGWTSAFWLHTLRQSTLIMMGTDDPIIPVVNGTLLAALIPRARLVTVADGHLFLLTSAHECAPFIAAFLSREPLPRASSNDANSNRAIPGKNGASSD
jgi:poly(3-hydroxyalkanoate) depolymerase